MNTDSTVLEASPSKSERRRLPDTREGLTHKFSIGEQEGYLTVGLYDDGQPGEIFLVMAKEGSTLSGIMDAFAKAVSFALQHGTPLAALAKTFIGAKFEPSGFTKNPRIPMTKSIVDYIFRVLVEKFCSLEEQQALGVGGDFALVVGSEPCSARHGSETVNCPLWGSLVRRGDVCDACPQRTAECSG